MDSEENKKKTLMESESSVGGDSPKKKNKKKLNVRWDEEIIAEHDQLRGHRAPINEPQTPYHSTLCCMDSDLSISNETGGVTPEELNEQLLKSTDNDSFYTSDSESDNFNLVENDGKNTSFELQRKAHYNEYHVLKELRSSGSLSDLD